MSFPGKQFKKCTRGCTNFASNETLSRMMPSEESVSWSWASLITAQKDNFITSFTDFGESASYFMKKISSLDVFWPLCSLSLLDGQIALLITKVTSYC